MVASLLAVTLALSARIDFEHPGGPASRVVEAMGEAFGVEATADPSMRRDYFTLALHDETFESARVLTARALFAEWIEREGKWVLTRSHKLELEEERAERSSNLSRIKLAQASITLPKRITGKDAEEFVQSLLRAQGSQELENQPLMTPLRRAIVRVCKEMDPELVADLSTWGLTTFAGDGSLAASRIPPALLAIIREGIEDQNKLCSLIEARAASLPPHWQLSRVVFDPARIELRVQGGINGVSSVELGVPVDGQEGLLKVNDIGMESSLKPPVFDLPESLSLPLVLSGPALEYTLLRPPRYIPGAAKKQLSDALLNVFLDHKHNDPLELSPGEVTLQAARAEGKSYVSIGSEYTTGVRLSTQAAWTLRDALPAVFRPGLFTMERDEKAVILRPYSPRGERMQRIDREKFAVALSAFLTNDKDRLDPLAEAVKGLDRSGASRLLGRIALLSRAFHEASYANGEALLLHYAALGTGQRAMAAKDGLVIDSTNVSQEVFQLLRVQVGEKARDGMAGHLGIGAERPWTYDDETREARAARELQVGARFVLRKRVVPVLFEVASYDGRFGYATPSSPEQAARRGQYEELGADGIRYRVIDQEVLSLSAVDASSELPIARFLVPSIYEGDAFEPIEKMPKWVRDRYDAELKRLRGG